MNEMNSRPLFELDSFPVWRPVQRQSPEKRNDLKLQVGCEYSGGSNTEQVRYSDGPWSFGSSPDHSKTELS